MKKPRHTKTCHIYKRAANHNMLIGVSLSNTGTFCDVVHNFETIVVKASVVFKTKEVYIQACISSVRSMQY